MDLKKHELYVIEPSGVMYRYFGAAVGKGRQVRCSTCCILGKIGAFDFFSSQFPRAHDTVGVYGGLADDLHIILVFR